MSRPKNAVILVTVPRGWFPLRVKHGKVKYNAAMPKNMMGEIASDEVLEQVTVWSVCCVLARIRRRLLRRAADENIPPTGNTLPLAGGSGSQARGGSIRATE